MDAQAKKLFRAKLNAQKQEKQRIDSPLVRYDEHDQLVCRVCDVVIKSDSLWPAHQVSRKHHEAISTVKANAAALNQANNSKHAHPQEKSKPKPESHGVSHEKSEPSTTLRKHQSSMLPPNFFDNHEAKRQKKESDSRNSGDRDAHNRSLTSERKQAAEPFVSGSGTDRSLTAKSMHVRDPEYQATEDSRELSKAAVDIEAKQGKRSLPQGFFDDKDADLRARGITPVKPDVKDEYKEFVKLIQEDLQEVDDRLEEEEIDAAEVIEEAESVEQRTYRERVELLRKKKLELKASRSAVRGKDVEVTREETSDEDSSSDDEIDEKFTVDWRAKHL